MSDTITKSHSRTELPIDMLERFRARAGELDRTNTYFHDDLAELRQAGYLAAAAVQTEFGGWGYDLADMVASQRRLARYAPATALALTMHSYWIGIAAQFEQWGDSSLRWIFDAALEGEVIAAGHAEAGNGIPVLLSACKAERVDGGYLLTGRKRFGSNGRVWTWLGAHAMDADAPGGPQVVHAFVQRTSPGVSVIETWDTLGMRATQSHDTVRRSAARISIALIRSSSSRPASTTLRRHRRAPGTTPGQPKGGRKGAANARKTVWRLMGDHAVAGRPQATNSVPSTHTRWQPRHESEGHNVHTEAPRDPSAR